MGCILMAVGALAGAGAVAMAAAAAHALAARLDVRAMAAMQSAIQLQGWHALALVVTGLWVMRAPPPAHTLGVLAGLGFLLGMLLFCGAIYANHLGGVHSGLAAPTGGILLIVSWLLLAASALAAGRTL